MADLQFESADIPIRTRGDKEPNPFEGIAHLLVNGFKPTAEKPDARATTIPLPADVTSETDPDERAKKRVKFVEKIKRLWREAADSVSEKTLSARSHVEFVKSGKGEALRITIWVSERIERKTSPKSDK